MVPDMSSKVFVWPQLDVPHYKLGNYNRRVVFVLNALALALAAFGSSWRAYWTTPEDTDGHSFWFQELPEATPNMIFVGLTFNFALLCLMYIRLIWVVKHPLVLSLMKECDVSGHTGEQSVLAKQRRVVIRCSRPLVPVLVPFNLVWAAIHVVMCFQFVDEDTATPSEELTAFWLLAAIFSFPGLLLPAILPVATSVESVIQRIHRLSMELYEGKDIDWNSIIDRYRELLAFLEDMSSPFELGIVLCCWVASSLILIAICAFASLAIPLKASGALMVIVFSSTIGAITAIGFLFGLLQLASINKIANSRYFRAKSVVSNAANFLGVKHKGLHPEARLAHQSFMSYTRDNEMGVGGWGMIITNNLVGQLAMKILFVLPTVMGVIKAAIHLKDVD